MRCTYLLAAALLLPGQAGLAQGIPRLIVPNIVESRTAEILRANNVGGLPVGTTATLTLQSPSGPGGSRIELDEFQRVRPADNAADSHPEPQRSLIRLKWNPEGALRYVIDCELRMELPNPEPTGFFSTAAAANQSVDIVKNHAGFLTTPGAAGSVTLSANGRFTFRGCSITPVG